MKTPNPGPDRADIIVIGGGPAGLMAAGRAGELGANVTLIEKNQRLGRKLLITGGGRCNVTNSAGIKGFIDAFGPNGKFLYRAFSVFSAENLTGFLKSFGVPTRTDPDGKIFPADDKAQSVLDALKCYTSRGKVAITHGAQAAGVLLPDGRAIAGVKLADGGVVCGKKVIIATGGLSYPGTGSTGDGYALAKQLGHTIMALRPGLTALESDEPFIKDLQGLTLQNIAISILIDGRKAAAEKGDLLFTHFGVSGPKLLIMSGIASDALTKPGHRVELSLNLKPELSAAELTAEIQGYFSANGAKMFASYVKAALPGSLAPVFERRCGIERARQCASITGAERKTIAEMLSDFRIHLTRPRPLQEATITRGGVNLKEINPQTMESRLVPGLYFCGEVLDLDGITGGYNLQEAFSTGYLAGQSAAAQQ
ncbi:MAG TPA: aminoacetone oxidase family FAD-binding enzyme [Elusimicrobia bacterium]|nr:aminoacetone oxidase family FAD-binding enzyme [Elusimicrobiota bacterium]